MPLIDSEAYVLVRHPLTESSWIVSFFTREEGVVRGVAKGGRRVKSSFRGALEPLSRVRVEMGGREGRDLSTVRRVDLLESTIDLYSDWPTASFLMSAAELLERGLPERVEEDDTYRLVAAILKQLREGMSPALTWLYFQVWFLRLHGILPRPDICSGCDSSLGKASLDMNVLKWFCPRCAAENQGRRVSLEQESIELLQKILRSAPDIIKDVQVRDESRISASKLCCTLLEDYLGRPLASNPPE